MKTEHSADRIALLEQLITSAPTNKTYYQLLANFYRDLKQWHHVCGCYQRYLAVNSGDAESYFNLAYYSRFAEQYEVAIDYYLNAVSLGISQPEEVYLNIAVIYADHLRKETMARAALATALTLNDRYVPALYNLANLHEDAGDRQKAIALFERVLLIEPKYYDALARIAMIKKSVKPDDELNARLEQACMDPAIDLSTRINLHYARGKVFDDNGAYDDAFAQYHLANKLNKRVLTPYNRLAQQQFFTAIQQQFSSTWFANLPKISDAAPIFICGMFRSGSTLTEQILTGHPDITAGGEREFFIRLISDKLSPFPAKMQNITLTELQALAKSYVDDLSKSFPDAGIVTDKRPENFIYLGLIKSLFPNARFIHTSRNPLDNCLSIYFLRLGNAMNYSTELADTAHYYQLQAQMMTHWKSLFGEAIYTMDYDAFVKNPEQSSKQLLAFLELDWHPDCVQFHQRDNVVKTASVWQVRQPLYQSSSGRWQHYAAHIKPLIDCFKQ